MAATTDTQGVSRATLVRQHAELVRLCGQLAYWAAKDNSAVSKEHFHEVLNDLVRCAAEHFRAEEGFFAGYGLELPQAHRSERMAFEEWLTDSLLGTVFGVIDRTAFSQRLSAWWDRHTLAPEWMAVDMPANPQSPARQKEGVPPTDRGTPVSNLPQEGGILPGRE